MRYPRWNNYCTVNIKGEEAEINNFLLEETYSLPSELIIWAQKLDGKTSPYRIDKSLNVKTVREMVDILIDYDCIRKSRVLIKSFGNFLFSIYIPQKITPKMRVFAWFYNKALQLSFLPMLFFGIFMFFTRSDFSTDDVGFYTGTLLGLVTALTLHEISHALATLACSNGRLFEIGIGIQNFMPLGYALIDVSQIKNKLDRTQVYLAGVESNILLCGVFLSLTPFGNCDDFFLGAALQNAFLGLFNLVFRNGVDGASVISELLGNRKLNFISKSREIVWQKKKRRKVLSTGLNGYAIFTTACIFQVLQLSLPALCIYNILNLIEVFLL